MKKYCFDMSGLSHTLEIMPEDIHVSMWNRVKGVIVAGRIAVTTEIYDEMIHINGRIGDCIKENQENLILEVGQDGWDWAVYLTHIERMQDQYAAVISELNGNRKNTVCMNDLSIIALGNTLGLPVVSMEAKPGQISETKKRIPEVCDLEGVDHLDFNQFLRSAGIEI